MRVALVHDWLNQQGGAEVVLDQLHAMFPEAPVHTSFYAPELVDPAFRQLDVRTSWLQHLPGWRTRHQAFLPLYPLAFQSMQIRDADVVVSNVSAFCKGIRTPPGAIHVSYCLTPTRFVWMPRAYLLREGYPAWLPRALAPLLWWMRRWDRAAAQRVTQFVAISQAVAERVRRFYGREALVVHPPVHTTRFAPTTDLADYFLVVSRLIPYKTHRLGGSRVHGGLPAASGRRRRPRPTLAPTDGRADGAIRRPAVRRRGATAHGALPRICVPR